MAEETRTSYSFVIFGRLPGLNQWIDAMNANRFKGAGMKKDAQSIVESAIYSQLRNVHITRPVTLHYTWYEQNTRRDHDNVSGFGHKVIQDALVNMGVLKDDGWDEIRGYTDAFEVDKEAPRIVVTLEEVYG